MSDSIFDELTEVKYFARNTRFQESFNTLKKWNVYRVVWNET